MELGIIGLGKIGGNFTRQAIEKGMRVVGKDPAPKPELEELGLVKTDSYEDFAAELESPRIIFCWCRRELSSIRLSKSFCRISTRRTYCWTGGTRFTAIQ